MVDPLHNDCNCYGVEYDKETRELSLLFTYLKDDGKKIALVFKDAEVTKMSLNFDWLSDPGNLDNLYRGRYEENETLRTFADDGRGYYYIDFYSGFSFELFAGKIVLKYTVQAA